MTAVAFIGLGAMGARMSRRLVDGGHESGTLRIFIGGPDELVQRWSPLLSAVLAYMLRQTR